MSQMILKIDGQRYTGWKTVEITRGIEQVAGTFSLDCADQWALSGQELPVRPGYTAEVLIDDQPVITGYMDEVGASYDPGDHRISFLGRDRTGDLVDCTAITRSQSWQGRTLLQVATDLCKPFNITVKADTDVGKAFKTSRLNTHETVFEALSRAARMRGCLLVSDGLGGLLITRAGTTRATRSLQLSRDILAGQATHNHAERFRTYRVLAQSGESDNLAQQTAQQVIAEEKDEEIRACRVTSMDPLDPADKADAKRLAQWTRTNRRARGERATITVRGWLDGAKPWQPNTLVNITDSWLRLRGDYLIVSVAYSLDDKAGEIARLTVTPKAAYDVLVEPEQDDSDRILGDGT